MMYWFLKILHLVGTIFVLFFNLVGTIFVLFLRLARHTYNLHNKNKQFKFKK